jgi:hypothetical protein
MARKKSQKRDPFGNLISEEEEETEDAIMKDGETRRVPMFLRDGAINPALNATQRAVVEHKAARSFGLSDALALHKPGFRDARDSTALDALEKAYREADLADTQAYKHLIGWGGLDATGEFRGQREGDQCTINGAPGHLRKTGDKFECIPDQRDAAALDAKQRAYLDYDAYMSHAWAERR